MHSHKRLLVHSFIQSSCPPVEVLCLENDVKLAVNPSAIHAAEAYVFSLTSISANAVHAKQLQVCHINVDSKHATSFSNSLTVTWVSDALVNSHIT